MSELPRVSWAIVEVDSPVRISGRSSTEHRDNIRVDSNEDAGVRRVDAQKEHTNDEDLDFICKDSKEEVGVKRRNNVQAETDTGEDIGEERHLQAGTDNSEGSIESYLHSGDAAPGQEVDNSSPDSAYDSNTLSEQEQPNDVEQPKPIVFFVQIPEDNDDSTDRYNSVQDLHTYFKFLYAIGVSAYGGRENERVGIKDRIVSTLQMIGFVVVSALALMMALENLKYFCLEFALTNWKLIHYIQIGKYAFHCLSAVYFVKFAAFDSKKITNMLDNLEERNKDSDASGKQKSRYQNVPISWLALFLGITSVITAFLTILFSKFTVKNVLTGDPLLYRSFDISYALFVWNVNNQTAQRFHELDLEYGQEFTATSVVFGLVGSLMEFSGSLQNMAIRDLMLLAALVLHKRVVEFSATLEKPIASLDEQVRKFRYLQATSKHLASSLGTLLTILHVKNMLLLTDFLLKLLNRRNYKMALVFIAIDLAKTFVTYIMAAKASRINQNFLAWIHEERHKRGSRQGARVDIKDEVTMLVDLAELKGEKVGLGSGISFVSVSFFAKFTGYVISCFLFFANNKD